MLSKILNPVKAHDNAVTLLTASFATDNAVGEIDTATFVGKGFTPRTGGAPASPVAGDVFRVSAGRWRFILPGTGGVTVLHASANLREAAPTDRFCKVSVVTGSTRTVEVVCWDVSGLAATDPADTDVVELLVVLKNSNLQS